MCKENKEKEIKNPEPISNNEEKEIEIGGSNKAEPTRYGDWEISGKCVDF